MYDCVVTGITTNSEPWVTNGTIRSVPVPLTVLILSPLQKANVLGANAGWEQFPAWGNWNIFNGCYWAMNTNVYGTSTKYGQCFGWNLVWVDWCQWRSR